MYSRAGGASMRSDRALGGPQTAAIASVSQGLRRHHSDAVSAHALESVTRQFREDVDEYATAFRERIGMIRQEVSESQTLEDALRRSADDRAGPRPREGHAASLTSRMPALPVFQTPSAAEERPAPLPRRRTGDTPAVAAGDQAPAASEPCGTSDGSHAQKRGAHDAQRDGGTAAPGGGPSGVDRLGEVSRSLQEGLNKSRMAMELYSTLFPGLGPADAPDVQGGEGGATNG